MQYLTARDVHNAKIFGRCEAKPGIEEVVPLVVDFEVAVPSSRPAVW